MSLEARKISFVQEFLRIDNERIIETLEKLLQKKKLESFEQNLKPMSLKQFNDEIDLSLDDEENDLLIEATDLKNEIQKWS
ncbi:MAG: hypothetical protein RBR78_09570 [Flavobacteriaceae bacterium]|jgi:hypothetical protein|nr:hypothetical protein [Flavobacteriaceae bacterium]